MEHCNHAIPPDHLTQVFPGLHLPVVNEPADEAHYDKEKYQADHYYAAEYQRHGVLKMRNQVFQSGPENCEDSQQHQMSEHEKLVKANDTLRTRWFVFLQMLAVGAVAISAPAAFRGDVSGFTVSFLVIQGVITYLLGSVSFYDRSHIRL